MNDKSGSTLYDVQYRAQMDLLFDRINQIDLTKSHYLMVLAGHNNALKKEHLKKMSSLLGSISEVDLRTIVTDDEDQTKRNIDLFFQALKNNKSSILFRNGDVLAGEYTGFTDSTVRYATPQEKYLLKKIKGSETFFILDLTETENIDMTLRRFAQSTILFNAPKSLFGRALWALRGIRLNGHTFVNKRKSALTA